eukprot:8840407-Alexandrium_andersonii.AAC.1
MVDGDNSGMPALVARFKPCCEYLPCCKCDITPMDQRRLKALLEDIRIIVAAHYSKAWDQPLLMVDAGDSK